MSKGIYKYTDLVTGEVVYVGKDSHIDKNMRHLQHSAPCNYDKQPFNRILQNNLDRYEYSVIWATEDCTTLKLNKMEILFGKIYNPKFNFDEFGKGGCKGHSEETKKKISEANKGNKPWNTDKNLSEEHKQKISESMKGTKPWITGKNHSEEYKQNMSESTNTSSYLYVYKRKDKTCKQGFIWCYRYRINGKRKAILSVDIDKLEEKVKAKGLPWRKI